MEFRVGVERLSNERTAVRVAGELDLATAPEFEVAIKAALRTHPRLLVVDLSELSYINSTGMYVLLKAQIRLAQEDGEVVILGVRPEIKVTLDLIGVPLRIRCVNSLAEAYAPIPVRKHTCHSQF